MSVRPFGLLSRLEFLQNWASALIAGLNPAVIHNLAKYYAIKKVCYLSAIEDTEGDYLEFGVFTGSSFCHALRCLRKLSNIHPSVATTKCYGFDSFAGFGPLEEEDQHPFYTNENFSTSLPQVERRVRRAAGHMSFRLIPGFFRESLRRGARQHGIEKARIIFIDSDTFASTRLALAFCGPALQQGTFIMLDDYFSYRGREDRGVRGAFAEFVRKAGVKTRQVFTYGMGGVVLVVSEGVEGIEGVAGIEGVEGAD